MAPQVEKHQRKEKKGKERGRWEGRSGLLPPNRIGVGVHLLPSADAPRGSLSPKASPSPPPIFTGGFRVFETQLCHVQLKPIPRSPCRSRSSPPPQRGHTAIELIYFSVSLAGSRRPRSSSSCTCAERGGVVRSALDQNRVWDDGDLNHKAVPLHQPRFLMLPAERSTRVCGSNLLS